MTAADGSHSAFKPRQDNRNGARLVVPITFGLAPEVNEFLRLVVSGGRYSLYLVQQLGAFLFEIRFGARRACNFGGGSCRACFQLAHAFFDAVELFVAP